LYLLPTGMMTPCKVRRILHTGTPLANNASDIEDRKVMNADCSYLHLPDPQTRGCHPDRYGVGPREAVRVIADPGDGGPVILQVLSEPCLQ
jgi:hypothetical protein